MGGLDAVATLSAKRWENFDWLRRMDQVASVLRVRRDQLESKCGVQYLHISISRRIVGMNLERRFIAIMAVGENSTEGLVNERREFIR